MSTNYSTNYGPRALATTGGLYWPPKIWGGEQTTFTLHTSQWTMFNHHQASAREIAWAGRLPSPDLPTFPSYYLPKSSTSQPAPWTVQIYPLSTKRRPVWTIDLTAQYPQRPIRACQLLEKYIKRNTYRWNQPALRRQRKGVRSESTGNTCLPVWTSSTSPERNHQWENQRSTQQNNWALILSPTKMSIVITLLRPTEQASRVNSTSARKESRCQIWKKIANPTASLRNFYR